MKTIDKIIAYETGELDAGETIKMFQKLINSGQVWHLQGSYGRTAMELIEKGYCTLGKKGTRDAYGNYVPSRTEVQPGTKGSVEYQKSKTNKE